MGSSPRRLLPVPRCTRGAGGTFNSSTSRSARPRPHPSRPAAGVGRQPFGNPAVRALLRGCRARPPLPRPGWGCGRRWRGDVHVGNGLGRPPRREEPGRRRPRRFRAAQEKFGRAWTCGSRVPPPVLLPLLAPARPGRPPGAGRAEGGSGADSGDCWRLAGPRGSAPRRISRLTSPSPPPPPRKERRR